MTALKIAAGLIAASILLTWFLTSLSLRGAKRMSLTPEHWALDLARRAGVQPITFYYRTLPPHSKTAAYAIYLPGLPGHQAVIFNLRYFFGTTLEDLTFITAHELGHLALGHCRRGFWRVALGWGVLLPRSAAQIARSELEADIFAWQLTGIRRTAIE